MLQGWNHITFFSVPNVFQGDLKIVNMEWDSNLNNRESDIYKTLSTSLQDGIQSAITEEDPSLREQLQVRIDKFLPGSVIVKFTAVLLLENGEVKDSSELKNHLINHIRNENGIIS